MRGPRRLVNIPGSPPQNSRAVYLSEQEARQKRLNAFMDEQQARDSNTKRKHTEGERKDRLPRTNTETLLEHAEIKFGELRLKEKFNLDRKVKSFFKYINIKRKTRENLGPSLNKAGKTQDS